MRNLIAVALLAGIVISQPVRACAQVETKTTLKKRFFALTYDLNKIHKVAIYPLQPQSRDLESERQWPSPKPQPKSFPDSLNRWVADEVARHIKHLDSAMGAVVALPPDSLTKNEALIAFARERLQADAVVIARIVSVNSGSVSLSGGVSPFGRTSFLPTPTDKPSEMAVEIELIVNDARTGELIWRANCEAKSKGKWVKDLWNKPPAAEVSLTAAVAGAVGALPF